MSAERGVVAELESRQADLRWSIQQLERQQAVTARDLENGRAELARVEAASAAIRDLEGNYGVDDGTDQ